jgi:hypothetical protein
MLRLAGQTGTKAFAISLGLIVFIVLGFIRENIGQARTESAKRMGVKTMRTKMKQKAILAGWSLCNSIWTMGANLIASALLA